MRVTVILIVVGALGTAPKNQEQNPEEMEIRGRIETIQTTALSKLATLVEVDPKLPFR